MVNYWLCVTSEENWEVIRKRRLWGVLERNKAQIEKVEPGDNLVFYVKPQRLMGIFQAASGAFQSDEKLFSTSGFAEEEIFPYRIQLKSYMVPKESVLLKSLVPKLKFITNKKKCGTPEKSDADNFEGRLRCNEGLPKGKLTDLVTEKG